MVCRKHALRIVIISFVLLLGLPGCAQGTDEDIAARQGTVAALASPGTNEDISALQSTVTVLASQNAGLESAVATQTFLIQYALTRPPPLNTPYPPGAEPTPYRPVEGRVLIEDGRCCVEGPAGERLQIELNLAAGSQQSEVTEMRVAVGSRFLTEEEMEAVPWEPFTEQKSVTIQVPLNWSGSYASAQFRDANGDTSFVTHDDIAVEGA